MSIIKERVEEANRRYVAGKAELPHPAVKFAILTCMDARMDPVAFAGLSEDAYVVRNAGGRVTEDAIRSLVVSAKMLGTKEWFVIHHTGCGMASFTNEEMRALLKESRGPSRHTEKGWENATGEAGAEGEVTMDFMPFADPVESLIEDVKKLRAHPLVSPRIPIYGYMYDIETGALTEIKEASEAGK